MHFFDKERRLSNRHGKAGGLESALRWSSASRMLDSLQLGHRSSQSMELDAGRSPPRNPSSARDESIRLADRAEAD
jgi:hypothetical protein